MKCANRGVFVCLQEGGRRKEIGTTRLFWHFHFFNVLEWGIIRKYGSDEGMLLVCCLHPYLSCLKKNGLFFQHWSLQSVAYAWVSLLSIYLLKKEKNSQACVPPNLLRKSEKHTISCPAGVCLVCINIIDDVDCSHKAQTLQLTTAARKAEFLKIYPHSLGSSSFQILPVNGGSCLIWS